MIPLVPSNKFEKSKTKSKNRDLSAEKKVSVKRHNKINRQKFLENPDECIQSFFKKLE